MDEIGIIGRNKARLVAQGLIKKKGLTMKKPWHLLLDLRL